MEDLATETLEHSPGLIPAGSHLFCCELVPKTGDKDTGRGFRLIGDSDRTSEPSLPIILVLSLVLDDNSYAKGLSGSLDIEVEPDLEVLAVSSLDFLRKYHLD